MLRTCEFCATVCPRNDRVLIGYADEPDFQGVAHVDCFLVAQAAVHPRDRPIQLESAPPAQPRRARWRDAPAAGRVVESSSG